MQIEARALKWIKLIFHLNNEINELINLKVYLRRQSIFIALTGDALKYEIF